MFVLAVAAAGLCPAAAGPFALPPGAKLAAPTADGKGWKASGEIALSFKQAEARLATAVSAAGWAHVHTIKLGKERILEAWSRGAEELTVMVWRIAPGRSGFSYGLSRKASDGKGVK